MERLYNVRIYTLYNVHSTYVHVHVFVHFVVELAIGFLRHIECKSFILSITDILGCVIYNHRQ